MPPPTEFAFLNIFVKSTCFSSAFFFPSFSQIGMASLLNEHWWCLETRCKVGHPQQESRIPIALRIKTTPHKTHTTASSRVRQFCSTHSPPLMYNACLAPNQLFLLPHNAQGAGVLVQEIFVADIILLWELPHHCVIQH